MRGLWWDPCSIKSIANRLLWEQQRILDRHAWEMINIKEFHEWENGMATHENIYNA